MPTEIELITKLCAEQMRNYMFSVGSRDKWELIEPIVCCPAELMCLSRQLSCTLYGIPSSIAPRFLDDSPFMSKTNGRFLTTEKNGLCNKQAIWCLDTNGMGQKTLSYVLFRDFREFFPTPSDAKVWLSSPSHRSFERIILIPIAQEGDK
jgi:hypothetical protein